MTDVCADPLSRQPLVIIATRGRPGEVGKLLAELERQTLPPLKIVVVGATQVDLPALPPGKTDVQLLLADRPGLTAQRNSGLNWLRQAGLLQPQARFVAFFDDDFRPSDDWLLQASCAFRADPRLAGLTGHVLADGVKGSALTDAEAIEYLCGRRAPDRHWSNSRMKDVESLYGCNMAVTAEVANACAFDEELPLYGWQEDCDYAGQARRHGATRLVPACRGVHLGSRSGRVSGVRMGYSQLANPIRIVRRGNMPWLRAARFIGRALLSNLMKSVLLRREVDYAGRLRGNLRAVGDLARSRCHPRRILDFGG